MIYDALYSTFKLPTVCYANANTFSNTLPILFDDSLHVRNNSNKEYNDRILSSFGTPLVLPVYASTRKGDREKTGTTIDDYYPFCFP